MTWDPDSYLGFDEQRARPAADLLARVPLPRGDVHRLVDLGAGAGNLVADLRRRFPTARITAVDSDPAMLERARQVTAGDELVEVVAGDLATWSPAEPVDLVFSNAALHWADDHAELLPRLLGLLRPNGVLAIQMPRNHDAPSHRALARVVIGGPWARHLGPLLREYPVAPAADYHRILAPLTDHLDIWTTTYLHDLAPTQDGTHPVAAWMQGSTLRPLLAALEPLQREAFWRALHDEIGADYPVRHDGHVLFAFTRLFVVARPRPS